MPSFIDSNHQTRLPTDLYEDACRRADKLWEHLSSKQQSALLARLKDTPELSEQLVQALLGSDYILENCCRDPSILFTNLLVDAPFEALTPIKIIDSVETACADTLSPEAFDRLIRRLRCRFMTALYWRDINGLADFDEVSRAMTAMAEVFIQCVLDFHYPLLVAKHGQPIGKASGWHQAMLVIGMGKLGGSELNVSSDIDLIFAFPEAGQTQAPNDSASKIKAIDNQQFFNLLGQRVIKSLNEITEDGFVFRVDMRLRPYGQSGALVSNFAALENYYEAQGRDWERYACIKARVVACSRLADQANGLAIERDVTERFYAILKPFVYRQYIDFAMIDSLRQLKAMIEQDVKRKGMQDNIKLGQGGIREIEFIAQVQQLIRGGREPRLQERNVLRALDVIAAEDYLDADEVKYLKSAYCFFRKTEHLIQAFEDRQTQALPTQAIDQQRLAWLHLNSPWEVFAEQLLAHRQRVHAIFQDLIAQDKQAYSLGNDEHWSVVWQTLSPELIPNMGQAQQLIALLAEFKSSRNVQHLSAAAREKLDRFMPLLLQALEQVDASTHLTPIPLLSRLLSWLESIVNRTSYVVLLLENPQVLKQLLYLFSESTWVASMLTQIPSLLDELLAPEKLYTLADKNQLSDELRQRLLRIAMDDLESNMEALRYFRMAHNLQVAACEINGSLPLMKVSDYLTFTAEVVLEHVFTLVWHTMTQRHGYPPQSSDDRPRFIVVGYGKLGGLEMSYSSDLDLVFIYDNDAQAMTDGEAPLDCQTFYTRLGQKMIHFLNTRTPSGRLYDVDMRLRPSGNSGLLVSSLQAYERYQRESAWVWEHQALVRARAICGDASLMSTFSQLRKAVLMQARDHDVLKEEVVKMRIKMREHLGSSRKNQENTSNSMSSGEFNLKQDVGGIVDIEFMVQYAVLAWSRQYPALSEWTDTIRILESLSHTGALESAQACQLIEIYQSYRAFGHRLVLQEQAASSVEAALFKVERARVIDLWRAWFG